MSASLAVQVTLLGVLCVVSHARTWVLILLEDLRLAYWEHIRT